MTKERSAMGGTDGFRRDAGGAGWMGRIAAVAGCVFVLSACRSEPEAARPAANLAPASAELPAAMRNGEWVSIEFLMAPGSSGRRPPVSAVAVLLPDGVAAGVGSADEVPWRVLAAEAAGGQGSGGSMDSGVAPSIWDGQSLIIDFGHDVASDLGLRLVLTPVGGDGGWEGAWQRITIAGPVAGGPVRVTSAGPPADGESP